jgi:hypothetical protein
MEDKRKRTPDEATLKRLAEMRLKANEVRKKKAELKRAEKEASKQDFDKRYEEKVLKAQKPVVEQTEKEPYEPAPKPTQDDQSEDDFPVEMVAKTAKKKPKATPAPQPAEPNYKQMYYQHKLSLLQQKQQQEQYLQQYSQLPPYAHAIDIAKHQIKARVDQDVLGDIYKGMFQC